MSLEDEDYAFICRLYSFLRGTTRRREDDRRPKPGSNDRDDDDDNDDDDASHLGKSRTWESISFLFQNVRGTAASSDSEKTTVIMPRIVGGKQLVNFNHAAFLEEFDSFEGGGSSRVNEDASSPIEQRQLHPDNFSSSSSSSSSSFGSYLHHKPDRALASLGCAIGLNVLTLWRRHQCNPLQQNSIRKAHPCLSTLRGALYRPRFYNLAPSSHVRMARIRTETVGRLISLRGTVTKARPKRLRVLDAGFTCSTCGLHQIAKFVDGNHSSPARCEDMKCRGQRFVLNRRVANFCDVQELKIQEVREELCEENEEDDGGGGGGVGLDVRGEDERDAGRAPRHMEVEVSQDLVDACHAGDSIVVCGIVRAVNSSLASGRGGKRAAESSMYQLYVVGHSIVNLTADDRGGGGGGGGGGGRGSDRGTHGMMGSEGDRGRNKRSRTSSSSASMQYTDRQLQQISNLAHADHRMYSMPIRMAFPFDLLVRSICPNIIGNDLVKAGIVLCLLGGTSPEVSGLEAQSGMTIRSNSHMLVVGDPGMGKSQMLLAANQVAARSVYVGGNTASSTGLTVSLTKEPGGDMGIEAGALVLADRGVCCLDELDKMPKSHQDGKARTMLSSILIVAYNVYSN
jgi:DNA replicative helicase MCM subunit Mcm2 (Cdc46/Mcm family)